MKKKVILKVLTFYVDATAILKTVLCSTVFILVCISHTWAMSSYSKETKLTLRMNNKKIIEVLDKIEEQSEFYFLLNQKLIDVDRKVDINLEEKTIENILQSLFSGTNVNYMIYDRQIVLTSFKNESLKDQNRTISGKVTDNNNQPLPGVTIIIKGTTHGTVTNAGGVYSLSNVPEDAVLVFSFVGMKTQEVVAGNNVNIDVSMEEETFGIEEIVAIGYGSVKKADLTGAVGLVSGEIISERKTTELSQALQGTMPGVLVTRSSNSPGSGATIRIRGITTIGDSDPLVIVDGIPVNNINDINPSDVESISVLKDAASASIYGARASSGVILITTKRGTSGKIALNYSVELGFEQPTQMPEMVGVQRYMEIHNEQWWNDIGSPENEDFPVYSKDLIDNYYQLNQENPDLYPITNWQDLIFTKNAPRQRHNVEISGGSDMVRSKVIISYDKTEGLYEGRSYERYSARLSNDIIINKYIDVKADIFFNHRMDNRLFVPESDIMNYAHLTAPIYAAEWSDGRVASGKGGDNIYGMMKYGGFNDSKNNLFTGTASINIKPFNGLKLTGVFSPQFYSNKGKSMKKAIPTYTWNDPKAFDVYLAYGSTHFTTTELSESRNDYTKLISQLLLNYDKKLGNHNLNLLAGFEDFSSFNEDLRASRDRYSLTSFPYLNLGPLEYRDNGGNAYENSYQSYFGRLMYNYNSKYYLQTNFRYDGSSRFHQDYRWGFFPSISAGWVITNEEFAKNGNDNIYLKLRASWGQLGNERIGNYPYQASIGFGNALMNYGSGEIFAAQTAAQSQYAIQSISWETTETYNLGFDLNLFSNKLRFIGDMYKKTTKDMLLALEIPGFIGLSNPDQNAGNMYTKGWEFEVGYNDKLGALNYSVSLNLSDFKSIMGDLGGTEFLGDRIKVEGSEFNEWYGYLTDGLFQTEEERENAPVISSSLTTLGSVKYVDLSGPDGVPDGKISPEYDRVLLGGSMPRYMYGGNLSLQYKSFDLFVSVQGIGKQNVRLTNSMLRTNPNWGNITTEFDGNYWSIYNTAEENLKAKYPRLSYNARSVDYAMSDYWLFDGRYLRIKSLTLGYTISSESQNVFKNIRLYTSMTDLMTLFSKYPKGWDPEISTNGYPITSSFLFGLSVNF